MYKKDVINEQAKMVANMSLALVVGSKNKKNYSGHRLSVYI